MDVQVIDVGEGNAGQRGGMTDDGEDEPNERREVKSSGTSTAQDGEGVAEPHVGMEFDSAEAAKSFYDEYASQIGFSTRVGQISRSKSNGKLGIREYLCARGGLKRRAGDSCEAMIRIEFKGNKKWVATKFVKEHCHSTVSPNKVHYLRPRRHFAGATKTAVEGYPGIGVVPGGVMYVSMDGNPVTPETNSGVKNTHPTDMNRTVKNAGLLSYAPKQYVQSRTLGRDAQNLLDYFKKMQAENPGFYYAIQLDEDNRMANVFWADARSRTAYRYFGEAVTLDTTYRANHYIVPFAPFTGVNHHGQTILFACALILDESEATFVWLFKTFLACMSDRAPVSMTTDQDKAIQAAVAQVLPESRHCIDKWHVLREGQQKMAPVCHAHPSFQLELYNCINLTETIEEFESSWNSILEKYDLKRNEWLQSVHATRTHWVPVYFRDSFSAIISPTQGFPTSFFEGYVNQHTTLPMFFRQYERALENSFEKEIEADFDTICTTPVLRTPSPMEKQAASLYTRKVFSKFQEELVETFAYTANKIDGSGTTSTFRVAKFEDDHKAYTVSLNTSEMKANCSCQMFEYSGILCRHILTVFTVTNVLMLPSHYILKRWTRNAKSGTGSSDEPGELHGNESLAVRYNNLCKEAIRCAEEGAISPEVYHVALNALREVGKKVAAAKKHVAKVPSTSHHGTGAGYDDQRASTLASDMTPLMWPRQDEMTRHFNLNDVGVPAQSASDFNLPRTAPVSLHREDGHPDNMGILPCLKSMTWVMEQKDSIPANRSALITLKLQDYSRTPPGESEVKFHLSRATLEPMLRSMAYISEQLSAPANRVAVINLKLQDTETSSGESEVKFQVSRDTLGAMLRSMAYIREQLSNPVETKSEQPQLKKQRK